MNQTDNKQAKADDTRINREALLQLSRRFSVALIRLCEVYDADIAKLGMKESELWLLYALDDGSPHSQKQIAEEWGFPRTTLNTTTKQLEAAGLLELIPIAGKRREKIVRLTAAGRRYAAKALAPIYEAEQKAMQTTLSSYSADFIDAVDLFGTNLKEALALSIKAAGDNSL